MTLLTNSKMKLALVLQTGTLPVEDLGVRVLAREVDQFAKVGNQFFHFRKPHRAHVFKVQLSASPATVNEIIEGIGAVDAVVGFLKLVEHGGKDLRVANKRANVAHGFLINALALSTHQAVEDRKHLCRMSILVEVVRLREVGHVHVTDSVDVIADKVLREKSVHS